MNKTEAAQFRNRWTPDRVEPLRRVLSIDASEWPKEPVSLEGLGIPILRRTDREYLDLRGFPLALVRRLHQSNVDFSYAKSPQNEYGAIEEMDIRGCELTDCNFDFVQTIHHMQGLYTRCSFTDARMREAYLCATFDSCSFDGATLTGAKFYGATFIKCSFRRTNLKKAAMGLVTFDHCVFTDALFGGGSIMGTRFLGCNLAHVDIADAFRDEDTLFDLNCDLSGIRFKETRRIFGDEFEVGPPPVIRKAS
jgi:uncharacterized protein YjbI with pentapeptide repeats